jgi:hypothetical protein
MRNANTRVQLPRIAVSGLEVCPPASSLDIKKTHRRVRFSGDRGSPRTKVRPVPLQKPVAMKE